MSHSGSKKLVSEVDHSCIGVGSPIDRSSGVSYLAETDGFVSAWGGAGSKAIYSDSSATPSTVVSQCWAAAGGGDFGWIGAPIKKGNYWSVSSASYVKWESLQ